MQQRTQKLASLLERFRSRRGLSILCFCLGLANLVWLNRQIYVQQRGASDSASASASVVPEGVISKEGEINPEWMKAQLARQPAFVVLPFEPAGYLPKLYLAQVRNFALELAKRESNYWVLVSASTDPSLEAARALRQSTQRASFVRDLLVQSGLRETRVLMDAQRTTPVFVPGEPPAQATPETKPEHAHLLVDMRVLEVQSQ